MKPTTSPFALPEGYADWLHHLKQDIAHARQRATLAVNAELVQLYGRIGQEILLRQEAQGWGAKVIDRLARDLKASHYTQVASHRKMQAFVTDERRHELGS